MAEDQATADPWAGWDFRTGAEWKAARGKKPLGAATPGAVAAPPDLKSQPGAAAGGKADPWAGWDFRTSAEWKQARGQKPAATGAATPGRLPGEPESAPAAPERHGLGTAIESGLVSGAQGLVSGPAAILDVAGSLGRRAGEALGRTPLGRRLQEATGMTTEQAEAIYKQHPEWRQATASQLVAPIVKKIDEATGGIAGYQPQGGLETLAKRTAEFAPQMLMPGGGGLVRRALTGVAAPAAGSLVGEKLGGEIGLPGAGAVAGALAGGATGLVRAPKVSPEILEAGKTLGVGIPLAAAAEGRGVQRIGRLVEGAPFAGHPLQEATATMFKDIGAAKTGAEQALGAGERPEVGGAMRDRMISWNAGNTAAAGRAYDQAERLMDQSILTLPTAAQAKLADLMRTARDSGLPLSAAGSFVKKALTRPGGLNFAGIRELRSKVMEEGRKAGILGATQTQGEFKGLAAALTDDMHTAALKSGGPRGLAAYQDADQNWKSLMGRRKATEKLIGKKGDTSVEGVFDNTLRAGNEGAGGNIALLKHAKQILHPDEWNEFAATAGGRMGTMKDGSFSYPQFLRDFGSKSREARELLWKDNGLLDKYEALSTLAKREKQLNKFSNYSNTAHTLATYGGLGELGHGLWHLFHTGSPAGLVSVGGQMLAGQTIARVLASPKAAAWFAKAGRASQDATRAQMLGQNAALGLRAYNSAVGHLEQQMRSEGILGGARGEQEGD